MFRYLPLVLKNGLRNRRRSLLTISSIAASMCILGVLMAMYHAFFFEQPTAGSALRVITRHRVSITNVLPISYGDKIRRVPGVDAVLAYQWFGGVYKEPKNMFARFAAEADNLWKVMPEYQVDPAEKEAFMRDPAGCIVGRSVAKRFGFKVGDRITLMGDIFPGDWEFNIRGIYDSPNDNENMWFHLKYLFDGMQRRRSWGQEFAGMFASRVASPDLVTRVSNEIDAMFRNSATPTKTDTERNFMLSFLSMLGDVKMILMSICAAVTFTIVLVAANTMAMSVRERVKEVGILKTLGFSNRAILGIILGEAAFISLLGGIFGYIIALGLTWLVRQGPEIMPQLKTLAMQPPVAFLLFAVAVLIGLVSSFVPAWNASRTPILDSLRYTG
jgi:putative ABC transport system permease protein